MRWWTACEQLELGKRDKKTLIVISDGGDNASQHKRVRDARYGRAQPGDHLYHRTVRYAGDPDQDPGILKKLAQITGGKAYFPD